jgi:hypothetical protein
LWLPFAKPTAYGLGKSGWVTAELEAGEPVPVDLFQRWIDESYRAHAPKRLVALLDSGAVGGGAPTGALATTPRIATRAPAKPAARSTTKPATKTRTSAGAAAGDKPRRSRAG